MKASLLLRKGEEGPALDIVNAIREQKGVDTWDNLTLDLLLEERGRELFWEGHRR